MTPLFKKLNLKNQTELVILNAPESFDTELQPLQNLKILRDLKAADEIQLVLVFATKQSEVDGVARAIGPKAKGDALVWFAYPKGTSKKYRCEFNRDTGWAALGREGFEPVRQVAIDEDWSALRFRRAEFIKTMTREARWAMSTEGKGKAGKK